MSFVTRLSTVLALLAAIAPFAVASTVAARHGGQEVGQGGGSYGGSYGGGSSGGSSSCGQNEFWYSKKSCCLPHGGVPTPPQPPKGHQCPTNGYYWSTDKGCCVPQHEPPPDDHPTCPKDCSWNDNDNYCHPNGPQPSGHYGGHKNKRALKSRAASLCPLGLEACPIAGLTGSDYECLDTSAELESCGGCTSLGKGQDCTAIPGAWNVGCEMGSCAVYTCAAGYRRSLDGKSCVAL